jgi:hypothetical protein
MIAALLTLLVVGWAVAPLLRGRAVSDGADADARARQRERLTLYYQRALRNIHDLDEDYSLGKLDATAYATEREAWVSRGVAALRALEALEGGEALDLKQADDAHLDAEIEQFIAGAIAAQAAGPERDLRRETSF